MKKNNLFAFEMRERIFKDGVEVFDSGFWTPNDLTHEGQAHILNVWAREQGNSDKFLMLLNNPDPTPDKTSTLSTVTESVAPGSLGYNRQQILSGDWSEPALDAGDMRVTAAQKMFGSFTGNVPVSHVALCSAATGISGTLFLYVPTSYFNDNVQSRVFVSGESYLITLRDKQF